MKKLMFSPAKTIFKHKVESGVTPPGASANEQANIRLTKFHGKHAGVPGWSEDEPVIPDTPTWAQISASGVKSSCLCLTVIVPVRERRRVAAPTV